MNEKTGGAYLLNPDFILEKAQVKEGNSIAGLGCGSAGQFVFPAARIVGNKGKVYAVDIIKMGKEMMQLYKDNKVNPLSSCFPLLLQLPFLIAVFHVFRNGFGSKALDLIYPFIFTPEAVTSIIELSQPNWYLALLAGAAQFWQAKMMMVKKPEVQSKGSKDEGMAAIMNKQMVYFMPLITVFIGLTLPGGVTLYLFVVTILTALQQKIMFKSSDSNSGDNNNHKNISSKEGSVEGEIVK